MVVDDLGLPSYIVQKLNLKQNLYAISHSTYEKLAYRIGQVGVHQYETRSVQRTLLNTSDGCIIIVDGSGARTKLREC